MIFKKTFITAAFTGSLFLSSITPAFAYSSSVAVSGHGYAVSISQSGNSTIAISQSGNHHKREHKVINFKDDFFGRKLRTHLSGGNEVPGPGDSDGRGEAKVKIKPNFKELCVKIHVSNIENATAAHIHEAPTGQAGPVVVTLPTPDSGGNADGCVGVAEDKLKDIKNNPSKYYVNVHNGPYPNGAIRGQLSR